MKPLGDALHQADQDADRADHLLHRGARHRQHGGHEEGRPRRRQGAALFRGDDHARADHRPDRRQSVAAGRRHERRPGRARHQGDRRLHRQGRPSRAPSSSCCTSSRTPWSAPSPRARSCRCCSSPSCSASRCTGWASAASRCSSIIDQTAHVFFGIVGIVMKVAPIGAFGAMAFTIGKYGVGHAALARLADAGLLRHLPDLRLRACSGSSPGCAASRIFKFIRYIKEELLIVLGTSSSESVLPRMMAKMEILGCEKSVVGLVIPTGYSFNLDGTCIYLTMAAVFLAQATNTDLTLEPGAGPDRHPAADLQGGGRRHRLAASSCWRRRWPRSAPCRSPASR